MAAPTGSLAAFSEQASGADTVKKLSDLFGTQAAVTDAIVTYAGERRDRRMAHDGAALYGRAIREKLESLKPEEREAFLSRVKDAFGKEGDAVAGGMRSYFEGKDKADTRKEQEGYKQFTAAMVPTMQRAYDEHRRGREAGAVGSDGHDEAMGAKTRMDLQIAAYAASLNAKAGGTDPHASDLQVAAQERARSDFQRYIDARSANPDELLALKGAIAQAAPDAKPDLDSIAQAQKKIAQGAQASQALNAGSKDSDIDGMMKLAEASVPATRTEAQRQALRTEVEEAAKDPDKSQQDMIALAQKMGEGNATAADRARLADIQIALSAAGSYQAKKGEETQAGLPQGMQGRNVTGELSQAVEAMKAHMTQDIFTPKKPPEPRQAVADLGFNPASGDTLGIAPPLFTPPVPPGAPHYSNPPPQR